LNLSAIRILYSFTVQTTAKSGCGEDLGIVYLYAMGRPAKNPEHPLTRLREALSTPNQQMTRALFSKKVGIPEATIKAIETGKFKISDKHAAQIASVTKVDPKCLIDPSLPLTDYIGVPLEGQATPFAAHLGDEFYDVKALFDTGLQVAEEKRKQVVFSFLFQRWLEETSEILGLGPSITDKLLEEYPEECFAAIPHYFWPKDRKKQEDLSKRVRRFEKELRGEFEKLMPETVRTHGEAVVDDQSLKAFIYSFLESIQLGEFDYAGMGIELRKKKIAEAKAFLQKKPKGLQTR
jgi:DNA-binding XRE family transcriptional regulator